MNKERRENEKADEFKSGKENHNEEGKLCREKEPSRRKRKRNSRFVEAVLRKKPLFNPGLFVFSVALKVVFMILFCISCCN